MASLTARLLVVASLAVPTAVTFTVPAAAASSEAPVVTQVVPVQSSTVGYADVVINGRRFTGVSGVVIGGLKATRMRVLSSHRLVVSAPPHGHGVKNVVVRTSHGTSTLSKATTFNYLHATLPGTWSSSRAARPADAGSYDDMRLTDTSCPTVSICYSIGGVTYDYVGNNPAPDNSGDGPVIRTRNGSSYSLMHAPLPADTHPDGLYQSEPGAIDCPTVGSCAAVTIYPATDANGSDFRVVLLTLSAGTWRAQAAPATAQKSRFGRSTEVSCGAPGECLVSTDGQLFRLSGDTWTAVAPVVPSGTTSLGVEHVSCPTATYCVAALASSPNTYLDVIDNNRLTPVAVHAPVGVGQTDYRPQILGLQCAVAENCVAVIGNDHGKYYNTDFLRLIGSTLDGQAHHRIATPEDLRFEGFPKGSPIGYEAARGGAGLTLDCPSTTTCFTTELYNASAGAKATETHSVVARLAGSTVHVFVMPNAEGAGSARINLDNLSCPSVSSCVAVGSRSASGFAVGPGYDDPPVPYETFANGVWTPGSLPAVADQPSPPQGEFVDLDCAAVGQCFADAAFLFDDSDNEDGSQYLRSVDLDAVLTPN